MAEAIKETVVDGNLILKRTVNEYDSSGLFSGAPLKRMHKERETVITVF
jgi:hypothetical protein